jgi:hypothetical protein
METPTTPKPPAPSRPKPNFINLDSLTEIGFRGGVDMRPTLIRVLTDLYVQKLHHTAEEEQHYTELALRLLDAVDAATRAAVATRLAPHLSPPPRVVQYLLNDLPEVSAPLRAHALLHPPAAIARAVQRAATLATAQVAVPAESKRAPSRDLPSPAKQVARAELAASRIAAARLATETSAADRAGVIGTAVADDLNEQFFTASAEERRLILLNLHIAAPLPPGRVVLLRDPSVRQRLEAAALGSYREELAKQLAQALHISRGQARRIARDDLGEPITVAAKALGIPRDAVYRILMFVNPKIGHSIERVHALTLLFDDMTLPAAEGMVAIWQSLPNSEAAAARHQPLHFNDERLRARPGAATTAQRGPVAPQSPGRRHAS